MYGQTATVGYKSVVFYAKDETGKEFWEGELIRLDSIPNLPQKGEQILIDSVPNYVRKHYNESGHLRFEVDIVIHQIINGGGGLDTKPGLVVSVYCVHMPRKKS